MPNATKQAAPQVFICEDEVITAEDLEQQLRKLGYEVTGKARAGEKTLELIERQQPDLVLMDILLRGEMDGITTAEIIRDRWGIPVVFLTAYADEERLARAKLAYPFGYLMKPFQTKDLRITVEMALYTANVDKKRRRAEEALRQSEERYQNFIRQSSEGIYRFEIEPPIDIALPVEEQIDLLFERAAIAECNLQLASMRGFDSVEGALGLGLADLHGDAGETGNRPMFRKFIESGYRIVGEVTWEAPPGGRERYFSNNAIGIIDKSGLTRVWGTLADVTTKTQAEKRLRRSEALLKATQRLVKIGGWEWETKTQTIYWSDEVFRIHDMEPDYVTEDFQDRIDKSIACYHPEDRRMVLDSFRKCIEDGVPYDLELPFTTVKGRKIWIRTTARPLYEQGRISRVTGIIMDITDLKARDDALKKSEARHRAIVSAMPDLLFVIDAEGRFVDHQTNSTSDLLVPPEAFLGRKVEDVLPPYLADLTHEAVTRALATGEVQQYQYALSIRGEERQYEARAVSSGENQVLIIIQDVTQRTRMENALRESEAKLRLFIDHAPVALAMFDREMRYLAASRRWYSDYGLDGQEIIGRSVYEGLPVMPDRWMEAHPRGLAGEVIQADEDSFVRENGTTQWLHWMIHPWRLSDDTVGGIVIVTEDITDRKHEQMERLKLESQLQQARKMEAVGTLAGGISHDFNNILQIIRGYTQLLMLERGEDDPDHESLRHIQEAGQRATELVRQLLLFSRKQEIRQQRVELREEIKHAVSILERTLPKMIDIEARTGFNLWAVLADPIQIEQIFLNLGTNAADAMPDGGKLIIETKNVTISEDFSRNHLGIDPGPHVLITVSDTGVGMDRATLEKIYEPFFTTKEFGKGTGLGLASVYGIVKSHGGYISCYSEIGQGTTFRIYLPALDQPVAFEANAPEDQPAQGGKETILLVDDVETIRDFGKTALTMFGYAVVTAESGEAALARYTAGDPQIDLVILDLGMPGMGGHACLEEILKHDPSARVLIASGYAIDGQVRRSLEAGAMGYIAKPYELNDLAAKVREALDGEP